MPDASRPGAQQPPRRLPRLLDWRALFGIGLSLVFLYFAFRKTPFGDIAREIRTVDPLLLLLATMLCTSVFWIRAWRWKSILHPMKPGIPFRSRFSSVTIGFMGNNLLPVRVGEFMRAYALSRQEAVSVVGSLGSLVMERLLDGIMLITLLIVAMQLPNFPEPRAEVDLGNLKIAGIFIVALLALLIVLILVPRPAVRGMEWLVQFLPTRARRPVIDALEAFLTGAGILRNPLVLSRAGFWSVVLWLVNAGGFYVAFRAFGIDLPFTAALFFQSCIAIAVSAPSAPGFIGPYHWAATTVLANMWGVDQARAAAYAITYHLAGFIPVTVIGLFYAWRIGLSMGEVQRSEETVEDAVEKATGSDVIIERGQRPR